MEFKVDKEVALAVCLLLAFIWRNRKLIVARAYPFEEYARSGRQHSGFAANS